MTGEQPPAGCDGGKWVKTVVYWLWRTGMVVVVDVKVGSWEQGIDGRCDAGGAIFWLA